MFRGLSALVCVRFGGSIPTFSDVHLFSKETVSNLKPILELGLKSVTMGVWAFWAFDLNTLIASYLGPKEVGA